MLLQIESRPEYITDQHKGDSDREQTEKELGNDEAVRSTIHDREDARRG